MKYRVAIYRSGTRLPLAKTKETKHSNYAYDITDAYGFSHINPLDIIDYEEIDWKGIEFNRLLTRDNRLYKFVEWFGNYPREGVVVECIGDCIPETR